MNAHPIHVDLPHKLGRAEARRRIEGNVDKLAGYIPGGATVTHQWQGDQLRLSIGAMGQSVDASVDVEEALGLMAKPIEAALRSKGSDLLLEDRTKK